MRVVVDTNVFISAGFKAASVLAVAVQLAVNRRHFLKSAATESELLQVLRRPKIAALVAPPFTSSGLSVLWHAPSPSRC
jgi:predicted nucleic acid-binding protein